MSAENHSELPSRADDAVSRALDALRARTPARLVVGRAGGAYRTSTQLELREDHAAAVDAVHAELDLQRDLGAKFVARFGLFEVATRAADKRQFLQQPDAGRKLSDEARSEIAHRCPRRADFQVVIGDGLSAAAVKAQVPALLPALAEGAASRGWTFGQPFVIRHARVGVLNDLGEVLGARVIVLLIGERPGLATAESLSAYMAYQPRTGHTDADRNLISNIHVRGVDLKTAVERILNLAALLRGEQTSGVAIKERLPAVGLESDRKLS